MAESMRIPSLSPAPRPSAGRRVKLPHPHLAPKPRQGPPQAAAKEPQEIPRPATAPVRPDPEPDPEPEISLHDARTFLAPPPPAVEIAAEIPAAPPAGLSPLEADPNDWTASLVPHHARSSRTWSRRIDSREASRAEKTLRSALWAGLCLNGAALLLPRLAPDGRFEEWEYSGGDFLLAAAVLLSGQALLALGVHCRRTDRQTDRRSD